MCKRVPIHTISVRPNPDALRWGVGTKWLDLVDVRLSPPSSRRHASRIGYCIHWVNNLIGENGKTQYVANTPIRN